MWSRGFKHLRAAIPGAVIVGPSIWCGADPESAPDNATAGLFNQWLDETKASTEQNKTKQNKTKNTFPDVLSWHVLYDAFDTDYSPSPAWEVPRLVFFCPSRYFFLGGRGVIKSGVKSVVIRPFARVLFARAAPVRRSGGSTRRPS